MTAYRPVVPELYKSCRTCFMFYCTFYFTCDRSLSERQKSRNERVYASDTNRGWTRAGLTLLHHLIGKHYELLPIAAARVRLGNDREHRCHEQRRSGSHTSTAQPAVRLHSRLVASPATVKSKCKSKSTVLKSKSKSSTKKWTCKHFYPIPVGLLFLSLLLIECWFAPFPIQVCVY